MQAPSIKEPFVILYSGEMFPHPKNSFVEHEELIQKIQQSIIRKPFWKLIQDKFPKQNVYMHAAFSLTSKAKSV